MIDLNDDVILANNMRSRAYVKYTPYTVGAVLTTRNGKKYTGCNIQNNGIQSYCAERVAFLKAISEGEFLFELWVDLKENQQKNVYHVVIVDNL